MTTYAVIRRSDQIEVYRYAHTEPVEWTGFEYATHDHVQVAEPVEPEVPVESWHISKLSFRNRFTQAEKVAIEIASLDVPTAPMEQRAMAAALRANQADVNVALYIDLQRPDTRAGVQSLETYGLIGTGRATEILDTPPTAEEVYRG